MAAWDPTVTYALDDGVTYSGVTYESLQNGNLNHEPDTSPTWWAATAALASKVVGYSVVLPQMQLSKLVGYAVTIPPLQVSKLAGYAVALPALQVSKLVAYAVLLPAPRPRAWVFKASFP